MNPPPAPPRSDKVGDGGEPAAPPHGDAPSTPAGTPESADPHDTFSIITLIHSPEDTGADLRQVDAAVRTLGQTPGLIDLDAEPGAITWTFDRPLEVIGPLAVAHLALLARPWWSISLRSMTRQAYEAVKEYRDATAAEQEAGQAGSRPGD